MEMENDVVEEYKSSLSDLNCNSKPMINALTIIAEENIKFAPQVVQVIENHINSAAPDLKLPVLYLIDSIMKNVGRDYLSLFSERIVSIFSSVFEKVDEKTRFLLYKLRQTWTEIMPNNKLYAIDYNVRRMDPAWPITSQPPVNKSTKGTTIHINPKFLTASAKKPEEPAAIREIEAKRKAQVLKQLLAKQEKMRGSAFKKEPEKKNNTTSHPVSICPPKSTEAVPVERRELQNLDPRIVQRDPRLKKSGVSTGVQKGPNEDKSVRTVSPLAHKQQCSLQKPSPVHSVVSVPKASSSQSQETDTITSKNERKSENSADPSKKKTDKPIPLDSKNSSSEQTKSEESKSIKRFPSPQKLVSELPHPPEIQDKTQKGQDSSRKTKADATASKNKSAAKEKLSNSDSKQSADSKPSEKSKSDSKDPHVESVKHSERPSKGSPQESSEAEKEPEANVPRNRSRATAESRKNSPRHRSRSPLHDEDKKKENKSSRIRSARHLAVQKTDGEKVGKDQEPAAAKNAASNEFPKVDTDLRVSSRSSVSPEKSVKGNKRDSSTFVDVENQENLHGPPVKKVKDGKENENAENVSWFGNQDQDYRCKERDSKINNHHQGWAQYKAVHPDEFKSPLRPARENMENIGPGSENFRDNHDKLLPKHSHSEQHQFGGGYGSDEYDRLGRPRLYRRRSYDMRFRGRYGRRYDHFPQRENFYHGQNDKDYGVRTMLSDPQCIIRQVDERFHAGLIDEVCYHDIRASLQKMLDSARKIGLMSASSVYSNSYPEHVKYPPGVQIRQAVRTKGPRPPPPIRSSFRFNKELHDIYFVDDKAVIEIDGTLKQVVLRGQPTAVYIEGLDPITVKFDEKPVKFDVNGEMHSVKFGVPKRELYVDDYPYEGEFDGPPFFVDIGDKPYSVRLGGPPPAAIILNEPSHEFYQKFLSIHGTRCSNARMSPVAEKNVEESNVPGFPVKTEDTDFRGTEDERTASSTATGSISSDIDMRTVVKKEPVEHCERSGNFSDTEYSEVGTNHGMSDMKDVDWRCHPLPTDSAPPVRNDGNYLPPPPPPPNVDFSSLKDSCMTTDSLPDPVQHPNLPRNQTMHSEMESTFRNTFTESVPQMHQNVWNGPMSRDTSDDRTQNSSEWRDWENSQERGMIWKESGPRLPQAPLQLHDRLVPRMTNMPSWRGGRFTPPYVQKEPIDRVLPPHIIAPQQPNWRQPLENLNESNTNLPGWDWKQRGYRPDVPPVHGHPYGMQRNESKPLFENYRGPYDQLPPPPMPPRGPLHLMGSQLRPDMSVPMLRPSIPNSDMRNSRPPMIPQRQWLPRNPLENMPPSIREQRPLLKFPHPVSTVSGLPSNPTLRTSLPPPPLPPNLPNIPVSLQGPVQFSMPRVPSPVVSEMSQTEPVTSQGYVPNFVGPEVQVKSEVVDTSVSSQGVLPTINSGPQQLTSQAQPATSQGNSVTTAPLQVTGPSTAGETVPTSTTAPPNVLDLSALMERLIAAGIIANKPNPEKMEVVEPEVKTASENTDKEEPVPPIEITTESLKCRYPGVVGALFKGTQCASCGMRFKDTKGERYKRHLDWHFRVNRREKDGAKKAFSRKWYYDVDDWIQFEEFEDFEERARSFFELQADEELLQAPAVIEVPTVPAARGHETEVCVVCGEEFLLLWVEEEEEWHLKDAVREDGQPYHPLCFEDFKKASEVPDTPVDETPPVEASEDKEQVASEMDTTAVTEDAVPKDEVKSENADSEEVKAEETVSVKQEPAEETPAVVEEGPVEAKEEPIEDEPLEGKPGEEEIIGVITEFDMEEEEKKDPPKESKMVVLQSGGGIVVKVRAESIQQPASPAPPIVKDAEQKKEEDSEEEFRPPTPDPRFKVLPPVKKGTELSGLCSIM